MVLGLLLNSEMMDYEKQGCLHDMFIRQAAKTPDAVAVVAENGRQMTFKELDYVTEVLAYNLRSKGVRPDAIVGIYMEKCIEYTVSYIAALRAGGAYMPMDTSYPQHLVADILEDAEPVAVLTKESFAKNLQGAKNVILLEEDWLEHLKNENANMKPTDQVETTLDNLAYVVYSSGTTGKPKGIMCPHRGAVFSYTWRHESYPFEPDDRVASNVFFVWEMFRSLLKGIPLYIIPDKVIYDPPLLLEFLKKHKITRILLTPSLLETVVDTGKEDVANYLQHLRIIWLCGEVVTTCLRDRILDTLPWIKLLNLYSISECHDVAVSNLSLDKKSETADSKRKYCPVGQLLQGVQVVILDDQLTSQPVGSPGEIYVAGPTLARGYIKRPELNAKRFIERPPGVPASVGDRLYQTGDWGYILSDGNLEICGRCDSMVKIRGYSIEIQAVESALLLLSMVNNCVVLVQGAEGEDKFLVAYVVPEGKTTKKEVRAELKTRLPNFMIPSYFVFLSSIPILPASGKLDKKALPPYIAEQQLNAGQEGTPSTEFEKKLASIWCDILQLKSVDVQDNFFDLGGHSLLAARLLNKVQNAFRVKLTVTDLFNYPTVTSMSQLLEECRQKCLNSRSFEILHPIVDLVAEVKKHDQGIMRLDMQLRAFWRSIQYGDRWQRGRVLLTGATGFLGAFILRDLLLNTQTHIYCLVRRFPDMTGKQRLLAALKQFGICKDSTQENRSTFLKNFETRVTPITGDVSLMNLGMSEEDYTYLSHEIDFIVHAAAYVNLIYPYDALHGTNVLGTQNTVLFACTNKIKPLHHISTNSVFPHNTTNCMETDDMQKYAPFLTDGYGQTKWVAEQLVLRAKSRGLPVIVYRLGNLSGDSKTAFWNPMDSNLLAIQGIAATLSAPDINWKIEMTPVDFVSSVIINMTQNLMCCVGKVFHMVNPYPVEADQLYQTMRNLGYPLKVVSFEEWGEEIDLLSNGSEETRRLGEALDGVNKNPEFFKDNSQFDMTNLKERLDHWQMSYPIVDVKQIRMYLKHLIARRVLASPKPHQSTDKPLLGQVAIVTGASSGIGAAIATHLANAGASVAIAARREEKLNQLKDEIEANNGTVFVMKTDVTNREQVKHFVSETEKQLGPVDILVNNAGIMYYTYMRSIQEDQWERTIDINCKGVVNGIGAVLPGMLERKMGHIVNMSSNAGRVAFPGLAVYSGSKFFVEGVSSSLRKEIAGTGVKVTCIQPGDVTTELIAHTTDQEAKAEYADGSGEKVLDPSDVARAVVYAVSQPSHVAVNEILVEPRHAPAV
ncbi:linear gramicidin synthase subunit D-like isoform X1 [Anneissia japonica]|uniref:linear gramicidin synthase subunit D-like isoform X1 n=1 Tax=Anneissia japonica TaxID=1529436 RepID=UPI001425836B|nr:linear gramicidin synthase subunit D-like isoform X1 [Anneissia japonica]